MLRHRRALWGERTSPEISAWSKIQKVSPPHESRQSEECREDRETQLFRTPTLQTPTHGKLLKRPSNLSLNLDDLDGLLGFSGLLPLLLVFSPPPSLQGT